MNQSFNDFEIIFVDNNSSDGSFEYVKNNFASEQVKVFMTETNLGFAGGNNFGYRHCSGEYVVLLNSDTIAEKDWLKNLIECISGNDNIGIAQSLVITEGISLKYYEKNGTINLLGHNIMEVFGINEDGTGEIFQANGCSLVIRKKLVDELGGVFPDEYFAYSEDTFLSFKVKFRGLKIMHTSKSVVRHKGGGASGNLSFLYFYQERNRLLNFLIFFPGSFTVKYIPVLIFNFFLKLFASVFSGKYSASQLVKAYLWLLCNPRWIMQNRKKLKSLKKLGDEDVLKLLSGRVFNGDNAAERFVNIFSLLYCRLAGIPVLENQKKS